MIVNRIGTFFILVGAFLVLLFIFSIQAGDGGRASYLFWGMGLFVLGSFLRWGRPKQPGTPSNRFRIFKREKKDTPARKSGQPENFRGENRQPPGN